VYTSRSTIVKGSLSSSTKLRSLLEVFLTSLYSLLPFIALPLVGYLFFL
jgi:hypothetical protein